jgi:hypothetical protein
MDVYENIQNNQYINRLPYPSRPTQKDIDEAMGNFTGTLLQVREEREATEVRLLAEYREKQKQYQEEDYRLNLQFQADLAEDFGVTGHPKVDKLFSLAWEHGHSSGYSDVYNYYSSFVELIN